METGIEKRSRRKEREETLKEMQGIVNILDTGLTPDEINALRERDTAKAIVVDDMTNGIKLYSCPRCDMPVHEKDNFCPECGQRLKR